MAGVRGVLRVIRPSIVGAAVLLFWDAALTGSYLMSLLVCPVWFLVSLLKSPIERPGWSVALARIAIPVLTLCVALGNNAIQFKVGEANARQLIAACEKYHAANGRFPEKLDELVPRYIKSIPVAKYCLGPSSRFYYYNLSTPTLYWQVIPPYYRKIYNFDTQSWTYLD